ncbi:hypothetical protein WJX79_008670 [Trebouxia sp. C0005]
MMTAPQRTLQAESLPAQLAAKVCFGDSYLVTTWQFLAHNLINAAVPCFIKQQHVKWSLLRDLDGPH